ncbi:MAG: FAD-dependent oxidoreductase, partial [Deltaproteobacteria bacterium]|nr:FAD-dependent oxidoreductase [Deltaproteobacteria bacterium]
MITFKLNGKEVQGEEGQYILQVAEKHGVEIPTLCYHKALEPAGMCRLCTVELFDGRRTRFVTACNYPIWEGMEVNTDTEAIREGRKLIVELLLARCPDVPLLKELATKYDIKEPRFKEEGDDCILCGLCVRICEKMGNSALSLTGRGVDIKVDTPFHVQTDVCMACGACAFVCPTGHIKLEDITRHAVKPIPSEYDMGLKGRKPIYVPYAQAVPNTPAIDRSKCMHFKTGGCQICAEFCGVNAIDYSQVDETIELNVGSIILAPGFQPFDPSKFETYSYTKSPNIITSMEFERILSATGPYQGHLVRPSDQKEPKKIAWLQCVGSRDVHKCDHGYCSSVCCMYAIKEAVVSKEHAGSDLDCAIFFMDMRTHGKDFERFYNDAKEKHGVRFICSRVPTIESVEGSDDLLIPYVNEDGDIIEESFDMIVLSVGLETPPEVIELGRNLGIDLTEGGFCKTESFHPVTTSREGIYVCGAFQGPKDIPQSVIESSSAAAEAGALLSESRNTLIREKKIPEEREIQGERPRIGVFVCHCGINIGGVVDVPGVRDYAASLPYVEYVTDNLFTCSTDTQDTITQVIREENLNRIVVAACTPRTHEPLFQETIAAAGLNKYLFEMTNIRNQDSWVHKDDPEMATEKAKDLVRMAVAKVALMEPLRETELNVNQNALVIGGGISGMASAKSLSDQGYQVHLVERSAHLGGQARNLFRTWKGEDVQKNLADLIESVETDPKITIRIDTELTNVEGFVGNFETTLSSGGKEEVVEHGIAVIATGANESRPDEYLYGEDPRVVTHLELDQKFMNDEASLKGINTAAFIQCVGSRDHLKELNPDMNIYILYRDIRTYGEREYLYRKARLAGIMFIRFSVDEKPNVSKNKDRLNIEVRDPVLEETVVMKPDLVVLASAIVPYKDKKLSRFFKVPMNEDGFFIEAHPKLRPVDFAIDGVFLCGMAHYPKPIDESIAQALAASSRAVTLLVNKTIQMGGTVAYVDPLFCSSCGVCMAICPYSAPSFIEEGP